MPDQPVVFDSPEDFDRMARAVKHVEHWVGSQDRPSGLNPEGGNTIVTVRITGPAIEFTTTTTTPSGTTTTTTTPAGTTTTTTPSKREIYWPGVFVYRVFGHNGKEVWYEDEEPCWVAPVNFGDDLEIGRQYEGYVGGYANDSFAVVIVTACCKTTTTSTTTASCTGLCVWTYDFGSDNRWEKTSSDCSPGCNCHAPEICPPPGSNQFVMATGCGKFPADKIPVFCFSTSTTTTSGSCLPPGCNGICTWVCHPVRGWQLSESSCSSICPCPYPTILCDSTCETTTTNCFVNAHCEGVCRWVWIEYEGLPTPFWEFVEGGCTYNNVPNCACDPPSGPGNACGEETQTGCYVHDQDCSICPCITTSTTTPSGCSGQCTWMSNLPTSATWILFTSCLGCGCAYPNYPPHIPQIFVQMPCTDVTTSTSTSTTTTTTTTTTPACGGICKWICKEFLDPEGPPHNYAWTLLNNLCTTPFPCRCNTAELGACNSGTVGTTDDTGCVSGNPFTSTTTTTTTTTTPAGGWWYCWDCTGAMVPPYTCSQTNPFPADCEVFSGGYETEVACNAACPDE